MAVGVDIAGEDDGGGSAMNGATALLVEEGNGEVGEGRRGEEDGGVDGGPR